MSRRNVMNYRSNVKTGNWFEELRLKEDEMKEYLQDRERGELMFQKIDFLKENMFQQVALTVSSDGRLHIGDVVMLMNPGGENQERSALSINAEINSVTKNPSPGIQAPCGVCAGRDMRACTRTAFIITSVDGSPEGSTLLYEQSFALRTTSGFTRGLYLMSDLKTFQKCAKNSRLQEVNLDDGCSVLSWWKIVHFDPQERLENEGQPVPANEKVLIKHCKTNQALAVLGDVIVWTLETGALWELPEPITMFKTAFGKDCEVTAHTFLDSHKAEKDRNHWILCTLDPARSGLLLLNHPQAAATNEELSQANPGM